MHEKENKMAYMPVNKLMITMGIPMILSMMLQAVYNIVDSIFVGGMEGIGEQALNALFLAMGLYIFFLLFGLFGVTAYIQSQTANDLIAELATGYLRICCTLSFGILLFSIFEKLLQSTGNSMYSTIAQIVGAVLNMVLDPVLIYGCLGLPALGVQGAAYATVFGQITSFLFALIFHKWKNVEIKNGFTYMKPSFPIVKKSMPSGFLPSWHRHLCLL